MPELLPVPAVKGGGVETVVNGIIDENEKNPVAHFSVYSVMEPRAMEASKKYKYTDFYFVNFEEPLLGNLSQRIVRKITGQTYRFNLGYFKRVIQIALKQNYDAFILENETVWSGYLSNEIKKKGMQAKVYVHVHNLDQVAPNSQLTQKKSFDGFIGVSEYITEAARREYRQVDGPIFGVVHNFVDSSKFISNNNFRKEFRKRNNIDESETVVLFSGRIIESKGIKVLFKAVDEINSEEICLLIIGNSWYGNSEIEKTPFQRELGEIADSMKSRVIFTGFVDHEEMPNYYSVGDVCVFPSIAPEAAGLVQLEAMSTGRITLVSNSGGMEEYIMRNEFVVEINDNFTENLSKKIIANSNISDIKRDKLQKSFRIHAKTFNAEKSLLELVTEIERN